MQDIGELVFLPRILARLNAVAPGLQLQTANLPAPSLEAALRSGEVDIALGHFPDMAGAALFQQRLFSHSFVCIVRGDHPTIKDQMTRRQFLDGLHAIVHPAGHMNDSLEAELEAQGLTRKVSVRIEHFLAVPAILSQSNLIFTVPYAIGEGLAKLADIKLVKPPFSAKPRIIRQHWHARFHHDPANRWLRSVVADSFMEKATAGARRSSRLTSAARRPT